VECPEVAGIPPDIRGALRGLYMSGNRDGAARLLEQAASRAERRRSHGPLTPPAGVKAVEPPHHPGTILCGLRNGAVACLDARAPRAAVHERGNGHDTAFALMRGFIQALRCATSAGHNF